MKLSNNLVVVAGGKGLRMGGDVPKQFMLLKGRPVIMRTIDRFLEAVPDLNIVVVLPQEHVGLWHRLCEEHRFSVPVQLALGGEERFHSVKNGISRTPLIPLKGENASPPYRGAGGVCAVHDAVRPLVSVEVIRRAFAAAREHGAVVPALPSVESVRIINGEGQSSAVDRRSVMLMQTPQVFSLPLLREAYAQPYDAAFTDDASVVEALGHPVHIIEGNRENIKLTTPMDFRLAEIYLERVPRQVV